MVMHHARAQEALLQRLLPLDAPIRELADLQRGHKSARRIPFHC